MSQLQKLFETYRIENDFLRFWNVAFNEVSLERDYSSYEEKISMTLLVLKNWWEATHKNKLRESDYYKANSAFEIKALLIDFYNVWEFCEKTLVEAITINNEFNQYSFNNAIARIVIGLEKEYQLVQNHANSFLAPPS